MVSRIPPEGNQENGEEEIFEGSEVVKLTSQARNMWFQLLEWCSDVAGRPIDGEELSRIFKEVQVEVGSTEPNYKDPKVMECFRRHLKGTL